MKLLICTQAIDKNDPILGFFHRWVEEFAQHFEQVHVICLREGTYSLPANVHVYSLGKEGGENRLKYLYRFYVYFSDIFLKKRVDFVFFHMGAIYNILAAPFFFIRKKYNTKFYWWKAHGHINGVGKLALFFVDKIFTASEESFPVKSRKKEIVGHAIDIDFFTPEHREKHQELRLLSVGRISRVKKVEKLIDIARILTGKHIDFHIDILGTTIDAEYKNFLQKEIQKFSLESAITFVGGIPQDALLDYYRKSDILVHASETGSIDKVVLEAIACGVIPIAQSRAYGDLIDRFNLCVAKNDVFEYVSIIEDIVANKDRYAKVTHELRDVVATQYALSTLTKRIFKI